LVVYELNRYPCDVEHLRYQPFAFATVGETVPAIRTVNAVAAVDEPPRTSVLVLGRNGSDRVNHESGTKLRSRLKTAAAVPLYVDR
jgi:hypothetical protein